MKKIVIGLPVLFVVLIVCSYFFIPGRLTISETITLNCTLNGATRIISNEHTWSRWWPNQNENKAAVKDSSFIYKEYSYKLNRETPNVLQIILQKKKVKFNSILNIFLLGKDSSGIKWETSFETSMNPAKRIQQYLQAKEIKNNMAEILDTLKLFLGKAENVYSMKIDQAKVTDTLLVSTKKISTGYPAIKEIYAMIDELEAFLKSNGGKETNYPMLNIVKTDSTHFRTMVAIPTDKIFNDNGNITFKRMVPGNILVGEITGGTATADKAFAELTNYVNDHQMASPAIPFQMLVTDRSAESDTSKWVTKLYYPVY